MSTVHQAVCPRNSEGGPAGLAGAPPVLLAGPTASGKSALALALAEALGGVVVNADSQQAFAGWRVLTARPSAAEEARAPHRLYGHVDPARDHSVGDWLREVAGVLAQAAAAGRRAVVVGGTGLYFAALTEGLAPIPPVPAGLRARLEARLAAEGVAALAAALARADPETSAALDRANPARVLRALEVLEATGRGLAAWHRLTPPPLLPPGAAVRLRLAPDRVWLNARIGARFDAMLAEGVLDEVRAMAARGLPPGAPGLRALGAAELMAHLRGEAGLDAAVAAAKAATRQYARRQLTWARGRMAEWEALPAPLPPGAVAGLIARLGA